MSSADSTRAKRSLIRQGVAAALLLAFYGLPWLRIDGAPALLLDLDTRQLQLFGLGLRMAEATPLLWLTLAAAAGLALLTVLRGRLWCAYACPQTVLTRLFRSLDRLTTLPGAARPLGPAVRHLVWASIALWTGISFVGYFTPIPTLV